MSTHISIQKRLDMLAKIKAIRTYIFIVAISFIN